MKLYRQFLMLLTWATIVPRSFVVAWDEPPKWQCHRYVTERLCPPEPPACMTQECMPLPLDETDWVDDPTDPDNKQIPRFRYAPCDKSGRFGEKSGGYDGLTCKLVFDKNPNGFVRSEPATPDQTEKFICWYTRNCSLNCVELQTTKKVSKRWKPGSGGTGNPGEVDVPIHVCADGVEVWEPPHNRPPWYSVQEQFGDWDECMEAHDCSGGQGSGNSGGGGGGNPTSDVP